MSKSNKNFCRDCGMPSSFHIQTWLDELTNQLILRFSLPRKLEQFFDLLLEKFFTFFGLISLKDDFTISDIQLRSFFFIEEARKRGIKIKALHGLFGYTNHFRAEAGGKIFRFESLPIADFASRLGAQFVDDKEKTKKRLEKGKFPIASGKAFWFWQKKKAVEFGVNKIGFPLVVKPRSGSASRHITTHIQSSFQLKKAVDKAVIFSPAFIVEKFISNAWVYRATVVDFNFIACVKQVPANIKGNGISTIQKLINEKNKDPYRGESDRKGFALYKIIEDETTRNLLVEKGYNLSTIPKENEIVYLQKDSFLKIGGDLIEVTPQVHPDNIQLFCNIAKFFDIRIVGIDFITQDISNSWKNQQAAILELNSVPCIELHYFPCSGTPQNVAKAVVDLVFKYYL